MRVGSCGPGSVVSRKRNEKPDILSPRLCVTQKRASTPLSPTLRAHQSFSCAICSSVASLRTEGTIHLTRTRNDVIADRNVALSGVEGRLTVSKSAQHGFRYDKHEGTYLTGKYPTSLTIFCPSSDCTNSTSFFRSPVGLLRRYQYRYRANAY